MNTRHLTATDLAGKRWRGYIRESTQRQAEKWSPERQRQDIARAAAELGLVEAEATWYERTGTGEVASDELEQALVDGRAGQYDVLLVLTTSRFARNRVEAGRRKEQFARAGIPIYFVQDRILSGARSSRLLEGVREVIDEEENEQRRFFIAGGQRQRQLSGRWVGQVPTGYRRVLVDFVDGTRGWDGGLEVDPEAAPIVRRLYDKAAAGEGVRRITFALNADGLRTPGGSPWSYRTVHEILLNPVYTGRMVRYRRSAKDRYYEADGADGYADLGARFPSIVDETLWRQVQEQLHARRFSARVGRRTYPLSRVLRCSKCGYSMTGVSNGDRRYYRCVGRTLYGVCDAPLIRAENAEGAFANWISGYRLPDDWRKAIAETRLDRVKVDERDRQANAEERLKRLRDLYSWGDLPEAEYRRQVTEIRGAMTIVRPGLAGLEVVASTLKNLGRTWRTAKPEAQALVPPLILKSAEVADGKVREWVVRAEIRTLLDLCIPVDTEQLSSDLGYTVRFSA